MQSSTSRSRSASRIGIRPIVKPRSGSQCSLPGELVIVLSKHKRVSWDLSWTSYQRTINYMPSRCGRKTLSDRSLSPRYSKICFSHHRSTLFSTACKPGANSPNSIRIKNSIKARSPSSESIIRREPCSLSGSTQPWREPRWLFSAIR